ncbi:hypothetical protein PACTADRAFT_51843 [Pachysolen tannophilus NRRL Y-2460]|uniref:ATPase expression protein 1 n=1 Tax=Pachysolen tannophilus NRRL Y-2460 TaxID=669874 RepID=A0A1E4TN99_PACTA|nr:hypothetical protein PACTADRAFT_51843 [Pachysolen tannophilus NRRL Y-2460]
MLRPSNFRSVLLNDAFVFRSFSTVFTKNENLQVEDLEKYITPNDVKKTVFINNDHMMNPLFKLNDLEILQLSLKDPTDSDFNVFKINLNTNEIDLNSKLSFRDGKNFLNWYYQGYKDKNELILKPVDSLDLEYQDFKVNLNNEVLSNRILSLINDDQFDWSLEKLTNLFENDSQISFNPSKSDRFSIQFNHLVIFMLQNLSNNHHHHVIYQSLCNYVIVNLPKINKSLDGIIFNFVNLLLYNMSPGNLNSFNCFENFLKEFPPKILLQNFGPFLVNDIIDLCLKYDQLTRAKDFIDLLLNNKFLPKISTLENYIQILSTSIVSKKMNGSSFAKFNVLTKNFNTVYNKYLTKKIIDSLLPFIQHEQEFNSLVSFIENNENPVKLFTDSFTGLIETYFRVLTSDYKFQRPSGKLYLSSNFNSFFNKLKYRGIDTTQLDEELYIKILINLNNTYALEKYLFAKYPTIENKDKFIEKVVDLMIESSLNYKAMMSTVDEITKWDQKRFPSGINRNSQFMFLKKLLYSVSEKSRVNLEIKIFNSNAFSNSLYKNLVYCIFANDLKEITDSNNLMISLFRQAFINPQIGVKELRSISALCLQNLSSEEIAKMIEFSNANRSYHKKNAFSQIVFKEEYEKWNEKMANKN